MFQRQREYDRELQQLASMRAFLREACQESWHGEPADQQLILRLELALTEAVSNIILHSEQELQHQSITLKLEVDDEQIRLTLQHPGKPFDPQLAEAPVFDGTRECGFGLYLIRQCVDEVRYLQDERGRCVVHMMVKRNRQARGEDHDAAS